MNHRIIRASKELDNMLKDVRKQRYKQGIDNKPLSEVRLSKELARLPGIKDTLIKARIKK